MDKQKVGSFIAAVMVLALIAIVGALFFKEVPDGNRDLFNIGLMAIVSGVSAILGYLFGSSLSSAKKDETISKLAATPPPEAPPGAPAPPGT